MAEENQVTQQPQQQPPPDQQTIIQSRDEEFQAKLKAQQELQDVKQKLAQLEQAQQKKEKIDKDALIKSWEEKYDKLHTELKKRDQHVLASKVDSLLTEMATKLNSEAPEIWKPFLEKRIHGELTDDGRIKVTCLDKAGNASALTPDELVKEMLENKKLSRYVIANRSKGSSEPEVKTNVAQFPTPNLSRTDTNDLSKMGNVQLTEYLKQHFPRKEA